METIRVLLVDDHPVVREGLRTILQTDGSVEVVGEASDGQEAVAKTLELKPDVVLMDLRMAKMDGVEATRRIKEEQPQTKVVVFTVHGGDSQVIQAVRAGASGFLLKDAPRDLLIHTIWAVRSGGTLIRTGLAEDTVAGLVDSSRGLSRKGLDRVEGLTHREQEVVKLMARGCTNKEIGQTLSISGDTAKRHVQSIISKLGASNRTEAAMKAARAGLVGQDWTLSLPPL